MAVSTCEGKFLARARKSDSRRCHVSTNVWKTCVFTTTRLHTPRRAAHEHPDLRIPRDARPSDDERVSARLARDDSKSLERRAQGPTATSDECRSVARFSKTTTSSDVGGRTFASPSLARGHPRRCRLRDARETDEVSLDILAKDDVGVLQVPTRRRPFASGPGNFTEKSREPRVPRDFHESRNLRRTSPFVTSTPRSSWLTDHLLDPSTRPSPAP